MIKQNISLTRDGLTLRGLLERPNENPSKLAILFHGFTGHLHPEEDSLYSKICKSLNEAGIATLRMDFSGHGQSDGLFRRMDLFNEMEDAFVILSYARQLPFVTGISLIGHSQGGVIAGMLAGYYPEVVEKLVLLAPAATLKDDAQKGTCMGTRYDTNAIPEVVEVGPEQHPVGGHYFRIARSFPIYEISAQFEGPVLDIHGLADEIVDPIASRRYEQAFRHCTLKLYEGMDHGIGSAHTEDAIACLTDFLKAEG